MRNWLRTSAASRAGALCRKESASAATTPLITAIAPSQTCGRARTALYQACEFSEATRQPKVVEVSRNMYSWMQRHFGESHTHHSPTTHGFAELCCVSFVHSCADWRAFELLSRNSGSAASKAATASSRSKGASRMSTCTRRLALSRTLAFSRHGHVVSSRYACWERSSLIAALMQLNRSI